MSPPPFRDSRSFREMWHDAGVGERLLVVAAPVAFVLAVCLLGGLPQ